MAENDPSVEKIKRVSVGTVVVYYGRVGSMRQGRTKFPAIVLQQHEDDGSLDMIVFFEAEDMIWEQRVLPWSETQQGHCWTHVVQEGSNLIDPTAIVSIRIDELRQQMYGDYDAPGKSMIEYLDDFDKRLKKLEKGT